MVARPDAGLTLRVVEGQEDPVQGWLPRGLSGVRAAPVGILSAHGVEANLLYVLAPSPRGAGDPVKAVDAIAGDPRGARISFSDGRVYEVHFAGGSAEWKKVR